MPGSVVVVFLFVGAVFGFIGSNVWSKKGGSKGAGFALGFFLGVIGLLIVFIANPTPAFGSAAVARCPHCAEAIQAEARVCKHCGRDLPMRRCPNCNAQIVATASRCPTCKQDSMPWKFHEGRWWKLEDGANFWYDEEAKTWQRQA